LLDYKAKGYAAEFVGKETTSKFTKKPVTVDGVKWMIYHTTILIQKLFNQQKQN
jgi:hypothetical protein